MRNREQTAAEQVAEALTDKRNEDLLTYRVGQGVTRIEGAVASGATAMPPPITAAAVEVWLRGEAEIPQWVALTLLHETVEDVENGMSGWIGDDDEGEATP